MTYSQHHADQRRGLPRTQFGTDTSDRDTADRARGIERDWTLALAGHRYDGRFDPAWYERVEGEV